MTLDFPPYFADAEADFTSADYIIFGVPYDKTSSFRKGAATAPNAIRQASWNFETYDFQTGKNLDSQRIHDYGNIPVETMPVNKMIQHTKSFTKKILTEKKIPIALGGEHSVTPGIIQAFPKNSAVIVCDAHLDFRNTYEQQAYNHACVNRRISDHVGINNLFVIGVRSAEKQELIEAKKAGLYFKDAFHIQKQGINTVIKDILQHVSDKKIYLSVDIDVLDPSFAPATSTPEPFGITSFDLLTFLDSFAPRCMGFDLTEVCPPYDHGQTALLAAKLIRRFVSDIRRKGVV